MAKGSAGDASHADAWMRLRDDCALEIGNCNCPHPTRCSSSVEVGFVCFDPLAIVGHPPAASTDWDSTHQTCPRRGDMRWMNRLRDWAARPPLAIVNWCLTCVMYVGHVCWSDATKFSRRSHSTLSHDLEPQPPAATSTLFDLQYRMHCRKGNRSSSSRIRRY